MLKGGARLVMGLVAIWGGATFQRGCRDVGRSLTVLAYPEKRDMRRTVAFVPNKNYLTGPDSMSVPVTGVERWNAADVVGERARYEKTFVNPEASDDSSVARG